MASVTMEISGAFTKKIDLSTPSNPMRELMVSEAERWREMEKTAAAKKSLAGRLSSLFGHR